jgi:hypothetical protein
MAVEAVSNMVVSEGTATSSTVVTFPWRARYIEIINDSGSTTLQFKFNSSQDYATLEPYEVVNPPVQSYTVYLNGTGAYRIRAYG